MSGSGMDEPRCIATIAALAAVSGFLSVAVIVILAILILTCYKYQMNKKQLQRFRGEKMSYWHFSCIV